MGESVIVHGVGPIGFGVVAACVHRALTAGCERFSSAKFDGIKMTIKASSALPFAGQFRPRYEREFAFGTGGICRKYTFELSVNTNCPD